MFRVNVNYTPQKERFRLDGNLKSFRLTEQQHKYIFVVIFHGDNHFQGTLRGAQWGGDAAVLAMLCDS